MTRRGRRTAGIVAGALACVLLAAAIATARPGGGNSYSSSSSSDSSRSYSSGGSSSGGDVVTVLVSIVFGVVILVFASVIGAAVDGNRSTDYVSSSWSSGGRTREASSADIAAALEVLRRHDPSFSRVLFEDFLFSLYAEAHRARHSSEALATLSPYVTSSGRESLGSRDGKVDAAVVGSLHLRSAGSSGENLRVRVDIDSNLHVSRPDGRATQFVQESWTLRRPLTVQTKPVSGVEKLGCPACGAPFKPASEGRCEACGQVVATGRFGWQVADIQIDCEERREHSLTGTAEEAGTDAATEFQPSVARAWEELVASDPALTLEAFVARLRLIFETLQTAWAAQDLKNVRPFVSERLYAYLQYWIDAYKAEGLRNAVERPRLEKLVIARVDRDPHYDAAVVRFWATGCDYTEYVATGRLAGGSRTNERRYSEYWTLVRSTRARGTPRADKSCPSCGAGLDVNMSGECAHCGTHVTSGEFDWVLSKIEQDEAYRG